MKRSGKKLALRRVTVLGLSDARGAMYGSYNANCSESCNTCEMDERCWRPNPTNSCPGGSQYCIPSQAYLGC